MDGPFDILSQAGDSISQIESLKVANSVSQSIPADAQYVTIVNAVGVSNPEQFLNSIYQGGGWSTPLGTTTNYTYLDGQQYLGYLWHNGHTLNLRTSQETVWSIPLSQVSQVVSRNISDATSGLNGFLITIPTGSYFIKDVVPVQKLPTSTYRTNDGVMTDDSGGWYKEFTNLGVITPVQAARNRKGQVVFMVIFMAILLAMILALVLLHSHKR